jgi:hypothetical protein
MTIGVIPTILGDGKRLFEDIGKRIRLNLLDVQRFDKDLVTLRYSVSGK